MFYVVGKIDPIRSLDERELPFRFSCACRDELGLPAFRSASDPTIREYVKKWCQENLSFNHMVAGYESVLFESEDDAMLFFMAFK